LDNVALVSYVLDKGAATRIDVAVAGAITQGREGRQLAPWPRWRHSAFVSSPTTAPAFKIHP